ncbi:MAG TPA: DM9 repeat-containing protein [Vicinamibacterales bacterium]
MHEAIRSSILPVAFSLLHATASAQSLRPDAGRPPVVKTEAFVADQRWAHAVRGAVPPGAVAHGREPDGRLQYVCRATAANGLHLGKVTEGTTGCAVVAQGRPATIGSYQVLVEAVARADRGAREDRRESVIDLIRRRQAESRQPLAAATSSLR